MGQRLSLFAYSDLASTSRVSRLSSLSMRRYCITSLAAGGTIVLHESIPDAAESLAAGSLPPDCAVVMLDLPENSGP